MVDLALRGRPNSPVTKGHLETRRENCSANTEVYESPSRFACRKTRRISQRFCVSVLQRGNPTESRGCVRIAELATFAAHGSGGRYGRFNGPNGPWSHDCWVCPHTSAQPPPPPVFLAPRSKVYQLPSGSASVGIGSLSNRHRSLKCDCDAERSLSVEAFHLAINSSGVTRQGEGA